MKRKLNITTKTSDLSEVLNNLKLSNDFKDNATFTLEIEIEETKDNYKYLSSSDKIIDWSFVDDVEEDNTINNDIDEKDDSKEANITYCTSSSCCVLSDYEKLKKEIRSIRLKNYQDIIRLFDSAREAKIYNTYLQLDDINFNNIIKSIYLSKNGKVYNSDLEFSISTSYFGNMLEEDIVISDIINKLNKIWDSIHTFSTIDSLINRLYN